MKDTARYSHRSVMLDEAMRHLLPATGEGGVYCDATLGGGGYAEALLQRVPQAVVMGIDRDRAALQAAADRLLPFGRRFVPVHGCFGNLPELLAESALGPLDGIVADLGVSSPQLDQAERGFSFQRKGPIDMRMDPTTGESALSLLTRLEAEELARILWEYGEERYSRQIAGAIKNALASATLQTTVDLAAVIARAIPRGKHQVGIDPATRSFQALRIAVNDEMRQLDRLLRNAPACLKPGGRLVVVSFHSLEDRLIKHSLRRMAEETLLTVITRRPVEAGESEIEENPRARSARLRAAEKVRMNPEVLP